MRTVFPTRNGYAPSEGPKVLLQILPLASVQSFEFDLYQEQALGEIAFIQGVFVDNSLNAAPLVLLVHYTQQQLVIPPYSQGTFPVLAGEQGIRFTAISTGEIDVAIHLLNVPTPWNVWSVQSSEPSPVRGAATEQHLMTTGASQLILAANTSRKKWVMQSDFNNTDVIYYSYTIPATVNGFAVQPGGTGGDYSGTIPTNAIYAYSPTIGQAFVLMEI